MSGEEDVGNNTFRVHTPEWRSDQLNTLLKDLDERADQVLNKAHPRKSRVVGTPCKVDAPSNVNIWMTRATNDADEQLSPTY